MLELGAYFVDQGRLPNPSLGSITLNWFRPQCEIIGRAKLVGAIWLCEQWVSCLCMHEKSSPSMTEEGRFLN